MLVLFDRLDFNPRPPRPVKLAVNPAHVMRVDPYRNTGSAEPPDGQEWSVLTLAWDGANGSHHQAQRNTVVVIGTFQEVVEKLSEAMARR